LRNIEILLRSRLVKETLSSALTEAEFFVFQGPDQRNNDSIVVIDFEDCKDSEFIRACQSRGAKIVALASRTDSQEFEPEEIGLLSGVLTYDLSAGAFVRSLRLICSGERVFPLNAVREQDSLVASRGAASRSDDATLSPPEQELLSLVLAGHSNGMIAQHLGTEASVKVHLKRLLGKLRVENRTQAVIWALANLPELDAPRGFV
jgi:two-component system nitrate/nitrite response regulator NarL